MAVGWSPSLETGVSSIDDDHKRLFELLALLDAARNKRVEVVLVKETVADLHEFFKAHFLREELLMDEVAYDGMHDHQLDHRLMITSLSQIVASIVEEDAPIGEEVVEFLSGWIVRHVEYADRPLAETVRQRAVVAAAAAS